MKSQIDYTFKIAVFGERAVGKTSLITRFITNTFSIDSKPTLGAAIHIKYLDTSNKVILLQIWDFGGEEKFRFLLPAYAYGTFGAIYMYDITKRETLANFKEWISVFRSGLKTNPEDVPILLVGGKRDLINQRDNIQEDIKEIMDMDIFFNSIECSAKTRENVDTVFETILDEIIKKI